MTYRFDTWKDVHERLQTIARSRSSLDHEEGVWLLRALRERVHSRLGYGTFFEYVERLFGYGPRFVGERLRVAEALEHLPALSDELRDGNLCWSVVRELTRVAQPETEAEWIAHARDRTAHEVEDLVSGRRPGDRPSDPPSDEARRHVLRFDVSAETLALVRDAKAALEREAGHSLDDDSMLLQLARRALGGPDDAGRASYQVAVGKCESCGQGWQEGDGRRLAVAPEVVEMAECDAQTIEVSDTPGAAVDTHVGTGPNTHVGTNGDVSHADEGDATHVGASLQATIRAALGVLTEHLGGRGSVAREPEAPYGTAAGWS